MSEQPCEATLILHTGESVQCLLEQTGPNEWQATPVRDVSIEEVAGANIDVLPGHSSVNFVLQGVES